MRHGGAGEPPRAEDVHFDRAAEDVVREGIEIVVGDPCRPARVVDEDVEAAESLDRRRHQRLILFLVADVGLDVYGIGR